MINHRDLNLFLIVGAQRGGTTYLYNILEEHPQIGMAKPLRPEPKFFINHEEYEKGKSYYLETYFPLEEQFLVYGEKSTSYLTNEKAPSRIKEMFPGAKLIFLLRNPIQRALSNYWFSVENEIENRSFAYAIKHERERVQNKPMPEFSEHPFAYKKRGLYFKYIKRYRDYFNIDQMVFLKSEKLFENKISFSNLFDFLNVDGGFEPEGLGNEVNSAAREREELTEEIKEMLVDYYQEPNKKLEELIGFNWEPWRKSS